jgi:hypothetical protein
MSEQQENYYDAIANFTRPWSERRGIGSTDRNSLVVLVRVPLDRLSDALAASALETRRDVLGSEIEILGKFQFACQIVGQVWSLLVSDEIVEPSEAQLSKQLGQPVIQLGVSDTTGTIGYLLFEDGAIVEYFAGSEGELEDEFAIDDANRYGLSLQTYIFSPYHDEDPEAKQSAYFWSSRRNVTVEEIGDIWDFAEQFILEYEAYDPAIDVSYLLGEYSPRRGRRYRVQNPGFTLGLPTGQQITSVPDLVRVDYFRFGN